MPELADIFRRHGPEYRDRKKISSNQQRAMRDIEYCRTDRMGGHVYRCENDSCAQHVYSYHSCKNRHCPKCQNDAADDWLRKQQDKLLPVQHFLVTATLPAELRSIAVVQQKIVYNILFQSAAAAIQKLARDPRFIGGDIGMVGVMHTWDKAIGFHPHIHFLIPGGGLSPDRSQWLLTKKDFLIRVELISAIFRAKFRDAIHKAGLFDQVPDAVWRKDWVVHCKPVGSGREAMIYLARYVFRVAITNNRIVAVDDEQVTFRCRDAETGQWYQKTLPPLDFIGRFLMHVLPGNFQKVRYYGLFSHTKSRLLAVARYLMRMPRPRTQLPKTAGNCLHCPKCHGRLQLVAKLLPNYRGPPSARTYQTIPMPC